MSELAPDRHAPWLVADIGGTNARFGLVTEPGGAPHRVKVLRSAYHQDLACAVRAYLDHVADVPRPRAACVAVAAPVLADRVTLTNVAWEFSIAETRRELGFDRLELVNDFTALAMAVPSLPAESLLPIGGGTRMPGATVAVIGPGTGLGVAGLVPGWGGGTPVSGEGGHVTIPAETEREAAVAALLRQRHGTASAESVLSGPGLVRLHQCLATLRGVEAADLSPEQICARGRHATDPTCAETVRMFCGLLGAFAGNVALTLGARGGVLLGGGILPSLADVLATTDFRRRFEGKPPMTGYLSPIATTLITTGTPALLGAAAWLSRAALEAPMEGHAA